MSSGVWVLFFSLTGFLNAAFLHWQYLRQEKKGVKMFCLLGGDCGAVVSSPYGTTLGVKNEIIGMSYYGVIIILSLLEMWLPTYSLNLNFLTLVVISLATAFSVYLVILQTFVLKKYCSWCLLAIGINLLIFGATLAA